MADLISEAGSDSELEGKQLTADGIQRLDRDVDWTTAFYLLGAIAVLMAFVLLVFVHYPLVAMYPTGIAAGSFALAVWGTIRKEKVRETLRRERVQQILHEQGATSDYFERLVNINVENLSAYYVTVKNHANKSFITSLSVGLIGFTLIGVGVYLAAKGSNNSSSVANLSAISGMLTEFISAVFFYLYNKTVQQMKEYHDSLLAVQNILLSFKLVGDTSDPQDKAKMISAMLDYLVGHKRLASAE